MTTQYITENYNLQTVLWDSAAFVSWATRKVARSLWLTAQLTLLALAYVAVEVLTASWTVATITAAVLTVIAQAVFHVALVAVFIVAVILTGGWVCRFVK